jgi:hypothetical protein
MITTIITGLKMEHPIVYAQLRYDEIRPLPNESNTNKNGRLRLRLIDLGHIIPIIISGRPFKPNLLFCLAMVGAFVTTLSSSQYYVVFTVHIWTTQVRENGAINVRKRYKTARR